MSESDTGETSRVKIKHIELITNIEGTTNSGDNSQDASNSHSDDTLLNAAAQKTDKNKKRKKHKNRRNKRKRETPPES